MVAMPAAVFNLPLPHFAKKQENRGGTTDEHAVFRAESEKWSAVSAVRPSVNRGKCRSDMKIDNDRRRGKKGRFERRDN